MRRWCSGCAAALGLVLAAAVPAGAADLTLKRVTLSSGGVGYFEYEAAVDGDASLSIDVALDQVDDVLKSLIVYDDGGRAGEITLPGREPLTQSFTDLPFDQAALASEADLLNALQGAEIRFTGTRPVTGRLVHVADEAIHGADGVSQNRLRVSVLTAAGLQQFVLQDFDTIQFADPALQTKVDTALTRLSAYRSEGRRRLTLHTRGTGHRVVRIGYVVAMPLWKASYRLSLPADAQAETARLQGWAVLENFSGQAWDDVELTLLSGNPVTFRQALYESYYVPRPIVPVEAGGRVLPPPDSGAVAGALEERALMEDPASPALAKAQLRPMPTGRLGAATVAAPPPAPAAIESAEAAEDATQIVFTLPNKVSVAAGQSLVVPLLDRELPTRRVDLYQPETDRFHPLAAIELTNNGATGLPPGVLTIYSQSADRGAGYLGDARLASFPAGEKRLLSFAVDNKVSVDRSIEQHGQITKATIADGVMKVIRMMRQTVTYQINATAIPPHLVIEHRRLAGYTLTAPEPSAVERTASAYRITATLDAKGRAVVTVSEDQPIDESVRLVDLDDTQLGIYVGAKELGPKLRQALADLALRRKTVGQYKAELDRMNEERNELVADETRLRDNYTALKAEPAMRKRALDKLSESETAIDANESATAKVKTALAAAESDLASYIAALAL